MEQEDANGFLIALLVMAGYVYAPWYFLNLAAEPHGQGAVPPEFALAVRAGHAG